MKVNIEATMARLDAKQYQYEWVIGLTFKDGGVHAIFVSADDHGHSGGKISYRPIAAEDLIQ